MKDPKKENKITGYSRKSFHLPSLAMISLLVYNFRAEFDIALHKAGINKHHPQQVMPDVQHLKIWSK